MNTPRLPVLSLSLLLILSTASGLHAQRAQPRVGDPFPVQLFQQIGAKKLQSLARFLGKKVLLLQFASW